MIKLKKIFFFILLPILLSFRSEASSQCTNFLNIKPYLGVIVAVEGAGLVLAIGPYFGTGHREIISSLLNQPGVGVETLVWGGELLISKQGSNLHIYSANETSGFMHELNTNPSLKISFDPFSNNIDLRSTSVIKSNVNFLDFFRAHKKIIFNKSYQPQKFNPNRVHIISDLNLGDENARHAFGNKIAVAFGWLNLMISLDAIPEAHIERIQKGLSDLTTFTRAYLEWQNEETRLAETDKKLETYLKLADDFISKKNPKLEMSSEDLQSLELLSKFAYRTLFQSETKPILYQLSVTE